MTMPATLETAKPRRYTAKLHGRIIGTGASLAKVPTTSIKVDSAYQRGPSMPWVNAHRPYDEHKAAALTLSSREGGPYVIDGQGRLAIALADGIPYVNAFIIEGLTQRDEADIFAGQRERRGLVSFDLFRAELVAGDKATLEMVQVATSNGFHVGKSFVTPNTIVAIDSLRYIQRVGGNELLNQTLSVVRKLWIGEDKALNGQILKGMALFLQSSADKDIFQLPRLEAYLQDAPPVKILRLAQGVAVKRSGAPSVTPANVAQAILEHYNLKAPSDGKLPPLTIGGRARPVRPWTLADRKSGPVIRITSPRGIGLTA